MSVGGTTVSLYSQAHGSAGWSEVLCQKWVHSDIQTERAGAIAKSVFFSRGRPEAQERGMETGNASRRLGLELGRCPSTHVSEAQVSQEATPNTDGVWGSSGWKCEVFRQTIPEGEKNQQ